MYMVMMRWVGYGFWGAPTQVEREELPDPPVAKRIPRTFTLHGDTRVDPYYWLRERENPDVIAYLEAENRYTEAVMKPTEALQEQLYQEMLGRIKQTDQSVPTRWGDYYYYTRTEEGLQYPIHCRKKGSLDAPEEVILDENELAEGHDYFRMGVFAISPNHRFLAYSTDTTGDESYTLRIKDLNTGELFEEAIPNTSYSAEWANDNATLFYSVLDETKRPYRLYRHRLGSPPDEDVLVYQEDDAAFFLSLSKTRSDAYLLLELGSITTSEVHFLDANDPEGRFRVIQPRRHKVEYGVEHHEDRFFILTNEEAINFKLMQAPVATPSREHWEEVIPHREHVKLDGVDAFRDHLVVYERERGLRQIHIRHLRTGEGHRVAFPEPVYTCSGGWNPEFDTPWLRFHYSSLVTPDSVFDYHMDTRERVLKKQQEVLGGYDASQYTSERLFATAPDGTEVPISLVYRKDRRADGPQPLLLYGYGAYGVSIEPRFSSNRLSLLDRGVIFAIAHVRGGGELGRPWYEQGKLLHKKNTFTDFIACAETLIARGYTSPEVLAIQGGSAGGLLMGAVMNMRPDLFRVVIAEVPFVDVLNTMLDPSIPLTVIEYEEWGNPRDETFYRLIRSYSPYDNVESKDYPHLLVMAGLNDPRVQYWEPAKWVAKLRATKTDRNWLLLKTNMDTGHGGPSGRYDALREVAFEYAFLLSCLGLDHGLPLR